jgi:hypothetical protein
VHDRFGDVFIDSERGRALPVDGVVTKVRGDRVVVEDRFRRSRLAVVYESGLRSIVDLRNGCGSLPLRP